MSRRGRDLVLVAVAIVILVVIIFFGDAAAASRHRALPWYAPLEALSHHDRAFADCVMLRESRSTEAHPNLGDDNGNGGGTTNGQDSGIFQMNNGSNGVWDLYAKPRLHVDVWRASAYQQAEGFVLVFRRDGPGPWRGFDGC